MLPQWGVSAPSKKRLPPRQPPDSLASNDALAAFVVHPYLDLLLAAIACASVWLVDVAEKGYYPSTTAANTGAAVAGW